MLGRWPHVLHHLDQPHGDASFMPTLRVSELATKHVKVVLTGDGGDEMFGGYDRYLKLMKLERLGAMRGPVAAGLSLAGAVAPNPYGERLARVGERLRCGHERTRAVAHLSLSGERERDV